MATEITTPTETATPAPAADAATVTAAAGAVVKSGASTELKIRQDEQLCKEKAHNLKDESATLEAIKLCEDQTTQAARSTGIIVAAKDNSASDITRTAANPK